MSDESGASWESHLNELLERAGLTGPRSRAAIQYEQAETIDELHYAAGEQLALHAAAITVSLRLPRRGAVPLAILRRLAPASWRRYWSLQNRAYCHAALLDLEEVRRIVSEQGRWPELSDLLNQTFVMACSWRARVISMDPIEKDDFFDIATNLLIDFQDHWRTATERLNMLVMLDGIENRRVDKAGLIKAAAIERSWLDPWAFISAHDRITALTNGDR